MVGTVLAAVLTIAPAILDERPDNGGTQEDAVILAQGFSAVDHARSSAPSNSGMSGFSTPQAEIGSIPNKNINAPDQLESTPAPQEAQVPSSPSDGGKKTNGSASRDGSSGDRNSRSDDRQARSDDRQARSDNPQTQSRSDGNSDDSEYDRRQRGSGASSDGGFGLGRLFGVMVTCQTPKGYCEFRYKRRVAAGSRCRCGSVYGLTR